MRKLLVILLLAAIACADVTEINEEPNNLLNFIGVKIDDVEFNIWDQVYGGIQWLKDNGYWDVLISVAKGVGKIVAINYCSVYLSSSVCSLIVEAIFTFI